MAARQRNSTAQHTPERICALYSKGPHYVRTLERLRAEYPHEIIVAAIPTSYPFRVIEGLADETIRLPEPDEQSGLRRSWTVLRRLRKARCSHIVVLFDSPRLNFLARLSGTGRGWCHTVDGRLYVLTQSMAGLLGSSLLRRLRGEVDYWRARIGTARRERRRE